MVLIAIYLLQFIIHLVRGFFIAKISKKSSEILMYNYFRHMLRLPVRFFHDRETGELLSRFQDIGEIQDIISSISISLILRLLTNPVLSFAGFVGCNIYPVATVNGLNHT